MGETKTCCICTAKIGDNGIVCNEELKYNFIKGDKCVCHNCLGSLLFVLGKRSDSYFEFTQKIDGTLAWYIWTMILLGVNYMLTHKSIISLSKSILSLYKF